MSQTEESKLFDEIIRELGLPASTAGSATRLPWGDYAGFTLTMGPDGYFYIYDDNNPDTTGIGIMVFKQSLADLDFFDRLRATIHKLGIKHD